MPIIHLHSEADYNNFIAQNAGHSYVIDFFATWCGPCKVLAPKLEQWSREYPGIKFVKVDVDENGEVAQKNNIRAMPTLLFYKNGVKVGEVRGFDENRIKQYIIGLNI